MKIKKSNLNWRSMNDVIKALAGSKATFIGTTVNLHASVIDGSGLPHPGDDQDEQSPAIRIKIPKFTLKNGTILDIPGGLIAMEDNITFENLEVWEIGEDGISNLTDRSKNLTIRNCDFHGASDKSIQVNDARGLTLVRSRIVGGITGARIQESKTKFKNIKTKLVERNVFDGCSTAWNISGGCLVTAKHTVYHNVKTRAVTNHGGKLIET